MQRILPESDLERKLMCTAAVFVEENRVLDEVYQMLVGEIPEDGEVDAEAREKALEEIGEYFFRLDMNLGSQIKADCLEILQEYWKVVDRESALQTLNSIRMEGHRTKFNVLQKTVPAEGRIDENALTKFKQIFKFDLEDSLEMNMSDDDYHKLAQWVQRTHKFLGESGILAWDMGRAIHLVRLCYIGGYLNDNEAWAEILKWASLSEGFQDWTSFSQSFLIGRTFWSGVDDPAVKDVCQRLVGHPASPWRFIVWT